MQTTEVTSITHVTPRPTCEAFASDVRRRQWPPVACFKPLSSGGARTLWYLECEDSADCLYLNGRMNIDGLKTQLLVQPYKIV